VILKDKVVVVIGVGPGLGREVARIALRDGARVMIAARSEEKLQKAAAELDPSGERVACCTADVADPARCEALFDAAAKRFGGVDALVQVAALDTVMGSLQTTTPDDWRRALDVNVVGTVNAVRAAIPHFEARGGGSIVLIGSQSMWLPAVLPQIAYAAAKGALVSALIHMAKELGPRRIRANMVVPTWMWGPPVEGYVRWQSQSRKIAPEAVIGEITAGMPLGEIPADEDVAEAVAFFCSDRSRMITGETLMVNAGELLRP
jgi:NAD(P)-dependent dehydrogenase (short-subunit alcohol dehydrogenase family)